MTCHECELLLADGRAPEEHLRVCPDCRAFAAELRDNAAALISMRDEPLVEQALACNGGFSRRSRTPIWIAAAAAALLVLGFAALRPHKPAQVIAPSPQVIASLPLAVPEISAPVPVQIQKLRRRVPERVPEPQETMLVKMLTPDPDVVIYWLVEPKEKSE
jgi:hypothetical protein